MLHLVNILLWLTPVLSSGVMQAYCPDNHLVSALKAGCSSHVSFCRHTVLTHTEIFPATHFTYTLSYSSDARTYTDTLALTYVVSTISHLATVTKTLSSTVGSTTTTLDECRPTATCGAVTADRQGYLREACSCILSKIFYTTYHITTDVAYVTTGLSTTTSTYTIQPTLRLYPVVTKTVPTKTIYNCITVPAPTHTCQNRGHEWAEFTLSKADSQSPPSEWDLEAYKKQSPNSNGTDSLLGGVYGYDRSCSGKLKRDPVPMYYCKNTYIADRGYIYAPQTGKYQFSIPAYLQAAYFWIGQAAYSGYNQSNALINATAKGHKNRGGPSTTVFLKRGTYYPFRTAFRCLYSRYDLYDFYTNIRRPDGLVMIGEYSKTGSYPAYVACYTPVEFVYSDYLVRFGCGSDAKRAPRFPDWGHET